MGSRAPEEPEDNAALDEWDSQQRQRFWEEQRSLNDLGTRLADQYDKLLVTLASGSLALSVGFLRFTDAPDHIWLIVLSWALTIGGLAAALVSLMFAQWAAAAEAERLINLLHKWPNGDLPDEPTLWDDWTEFCNWASLVLVLGGFCFFAGFAYANIPATVNQPDQSQHVNEEFRSNDKEGSKKESRRKVSDEEVDEEESVKEKAGKKVNEEESNEEGG